MYRPKSLLSVLAPCLALLAGCGGDGGSSSSSPFRGSYTGTYTAPFLDDTGTYSVTVAKSGSISGTGFSNNLNAGGALTGRIRSSGDVTASLAFDNGTSATLTGTLVQGTDGDLTGTLSETYGNATGDVTVVLTPVTVLP